MGLTFDLDTVAAVGDLMNQLDKKNITFIDENGSLILQMFIFFLGGPRYPTEIPEKLMLPAKNSKEEIRPCSQNGLETVF